jgi:beta-glucosidase
MAPATGSDDRPDTRPTVKAFDAEEIHAGNFALGVDHEKVARETDALMARMSLEQKIHEIRGRGPQPVDSLWYAGGDAALGIAPWKMVDGPRGARAGVATAFPVAIARAASFDVGLERRVGMAIGLEVAARGGNVLLAPTVNLLRHPGWGRAQETYSEDPHHMGAMGAAFVSGAQNFVLTSPKHFALNNLENTRFQLSSEIGPRALHEVYLPHFKRCVIEAGAASVMSAYNKMNGTYCGEHPELLDAILRGDWGFTGFVESDWFLGTRSTAPAISAGMDIEMPAGFRFSDENLEEALASGELSEEEIHRNARRSVYQKVAWQLTEDGVAGKARPDASVVECDEHVALAREAAEKSIVLLRNVGETLPLTRGEGVSIAVVGDDVAVVVAGLTYKHEGEFIPTAQQEAEGGDLARGGDRSTLDLPAEERQLIERAAAAAKRTVVVLQGGSAIIVRSWVDRVDALLMAWYGGMQGGHALARVLFGDVSPSGRLPVSFPRAMEDLMPWDVTALSVEHGLYHGYRWLDHHGHAAEFPFGFGLGYTSFELDALRIERVDGGFVCRVDVRNSGSRSGAAVVQLYVSCRDSRVVRVEKELKGFGRVVLEAGAEATLEIEIRDEDLCFYDEEAGAWELEDCRYVFHVGQSSADLPLEAEVSVRDALDG